MERYPLAISVKDTRIARSGFGFSHTEYAIEIDDCGRVYPRYRRFNQFVWLHGELRRLELPCALPELPPKKALRNMGQAFVDQRRMRLEEYVRALLRLPPVILDDTLWTFLDTDRATAQVPRFLCRPPAQVAAATCLEELRLVAEKQGEVFRFCSSIVLEQLVAFMQAEAQEAAVEAPPAAQQELQARLGNRARLCSVVQPLLAHERARRCLVDAGLFGALLALLCRATEDGEATATASSAPRDAAERHGAVCSAAISCLKGLLEQSAGGALLQFCQQDDGLSALSRLADTNVASLHHVAASLIWHGMQNRDVVTALVGSARGLQLLGKLLRSGDLRANVFSSLCVCRIAALENENSRDCLDALEQEPLADKLDRAEAEAMTRVAATLLSGNASRAEPDPRDLSSQRLPSDATRVQAVSSSAAPQQVAARQVVGMPADASQPHQYAPSTLKRQKSATDDDAAFPDHLKEQRDQELVDTLRTLCSPSHLQRLAALLGEVGTEAHAATATVVAVLDHFTRQSSGQPARLRDLRPLVPRLQELIELTGGFETVASQEQFEDVEYAEAAASLKCSSTGSSTWNSGAAQDSRTSSGVAREDLWIRAARIVVNVEWPESCEEEDDRRPPLNLIGHRTWILEALTQHCRAGSEEAKAWLEQKRHNCRQQAEQVEAGQLKEALCLNETILADFRARYVHLGEQRVALVHDEISAQQALDSIFASLDQRGVKQGLLRTDVGKQRSAIAINAEQELRFVEAQAAFRESETRHAEAEKLVDEGSQRLRQAQELACAKADVARAVLERKTEADRRRSEAAEVLHNAPGRRARVQAHLVDVARRGESLQEKVPLLRLEAKTVQTSLASLRASLQETEEALRNQAGINAELKTFHSSLNNELVLSEEEVRQLQQFESRLQPVRPERLRRHRVESLQPAMPSGPGEAGDDCNRSAGEAGGTGGTDGAGASGEEVKAPLWDDAGAEKDFRAAPHYRSFCRLLEERERLWKQEQAWRRSSLESAEAEERKLQQRLREQESAVEAHQGEEETLRRELLALESPEIMQKLLEEAGEAAQAAQEEAYHAQTEANETEGVMKLAEAHLEQVQAKAAEAGAALAAAKQVAAMEAEKFERVREELKGKCLELEARARWDLEEWTRLELDERRLELLQEQVNARLAEEQQSRHRLREEVQRLQEDLKRLDDQLCADAGNWSDQR